MDQVSSIASEGETGHRVSVIDVALSVLMTLCY